MLKGSFGVVEIYRCSSSRLGRAQSSREQLACVRHILQAGFHGDSQVNEVCTDEVDNLREFENQRYKVDGPTVCVIFIIRSPAL